METKLKRPLEGADLTSPAKKFKKDKSTKMMADWNRFPTEVIYDLTQRKQKNLIPTLNIFGSFLSKYLLRWTIILV